MKRCDNSKDKTAIFVRVKLKLKLKLDKDKAEVEITLGWIISFKATSEYQECKGKELIVKISWLAIIYESEAYLVKTARDMMQTIMQEAKLDWTLNHLPNILLSQDFNYNVDSTQVKLITFFKNASWIEEKKVEYEEQICQIIV
ncbi:hypothetical protein DFS33DRAFT_1269796 [Desarmillaria ectypa]|nr:hypothetical protein DFS33DRAFT_1269796 [Desarmillaria ectypa]